MHQFQYGVSMNEDTYVIREIDPRDISAVKAFTDRWIGVNYFDEDRIENMISLAQCNSMNASFVAYHNQELAAVRLTYAPGTWLDKVRGLSRDKWNVPSDKVAYFQSLFVAENHQAHGLGRRLSNASIEVLKKMEAQAVLCHSWLESPNNSSVRYLNKMGFEQVATHKLFWNPIDYQCTRCAPAKCQCTAAEMIKYLS